MSIDWNALFQTLTSTAIIVAALAYLSKTILSYLLERDIEKLKGDLKSNSDVQFAVFKGDLDLRANEALEAVKKQHADDLAKAQNDLQKKLEDYRAEIGLRVSQKERIREQIVHWANPILEAVTSLEERLHNILYLNGYPALSKQPEQKIDPDWSISYDYFMPSTLFLFAKYFYYITLLEEHMSFELFESQKEKDKFFSFIYEVKKSLGVFPGNYDGAGRDMQVFNLQQRGIGETLIIRDGGPVRYMGFHEFRQALNNPIISQELIPLKNLVENLNPKEERRWKRLKATHYHLRNLKQHCEELLQVKRMDPIEEDSKSTV